MGKTLKNIHKFHQTKSGYIFFGLTELLLAYIAISIALDSASMWWYALGILLFIGSIMNLVGFFRGPFTRLRKARNARTGR